jgi:ATP-dependent DNA ligase
MPAKRREVYEAIAKFQSPECPFVNLPEKKGAYPMDEEKMKTFRWVKPEVMAEIAFNNRTTQGHLGHSRFLRLRPDKKFGGCKKGKAQ